MSTLKRFGVSMDENLLEKFDTLIKEKGYENRSEAIRDFVREQLVSEEWKTEKGEKVGTVTLVYNHHKRGLSDELNEIQHHMGKYIISTMHIHLDHDNCLEVIILKGKVKEIEKLANNITCLKGVKLSKMNIMTTGRGLV